MPDLPPLHINPPSMDGKTNGARYPTDTDDSMELAIAAGIVGRLISDGAIRLDFKDKDWPNVFENAVYTVFYVLDEFYS